MVERGEFPFLNILQVNIFDIAGGAARVAWSLFDRYRQRGHDSYLAVGRKFGTDPDVFEIPNDASRNIWANFWNRAERQLTNHRIRLLPGLARNLGGIGEPRRWVERQEGIEDFNFPGTHSLFDLLPGTPEVLHAHVLHSGYFDLRVLPLLSSRAPTVITLHDEWMATGHCACSLGCNRWEAGCGHCPDLRIYPSIKRDATTHNWLRKRSIYEGSRLYVATPSKWLMEKARRSILGPAIIESRVIPNGVDLSVFRPWDKRQAREELGIPQDAWVTLFVGHGIRSNPFKDYATIEQAFLNFSAYYPTVKNILICLGENAHDQGSESALIQFVGYQDDSQTMARYYQSSDVYVHAAESEVWGLTITEALACGIPVIATAVGGIPEQIEEGLTGFLVPTKDSKSMVSRMRHLRENDGVRAEISRRAADCAKQRFGLDRMVDDYLTWYEEILENDLHTGWKVKQYQRSGH